MPGFVFVLLVIVTVGVLLWLVNRYLPMDARVKQILNAVVVIGLVLWLLWIAWGAFGAVRGPDLRVPR